MEEGSASTSERPLKRARNSTRIAGVAGPSRAEHVTQPDSGKAKAAVIPELRPSKLTGPLPPYGEKVSFISDPCERKIYVFNGERPGDDTYTPTSDFYRLDMETKKWTNLTSALTFTDPNWSPYSDFVERKKELPLKSYPTCVLFRRHGRSLLLIFGGFDYDKDANTDKPSSQLIVVDLRSLKWWFEEVKGGPVKGRINPALAIVNDRLFVFAGYQNFRGDGNPLASYSVASLEKNGNTYSWTWQKCDVPYPPHVLATTKFGRATPVYEGRKILLTPGSTTDDPRLEFSSQNMFFFHTRWEDFQPVAAHGELPTGVLCASILVLPTVESRQTPSVQEVGSSSSTPAKRKSIRSESSETSSPSTPTVLICGYVPARGIYDVVPEFWRMYPSPVEEVVKLEIRDMLKALDGPRFGGAAVFGDKLILIGTSDEAKKLIHRKDCDTWVNANAKWDIYLEIDYRKLPRW